jgi:hypothetical protein
MLQRLDCQVQIYLPYCSKLREFILFFYLWFVADPLRANSRSHICLLITPEVP